MRAWRASIACAAWASSCRWIDRTSVRLARTITPAPELRTDCTPTNMPAGYSKNPLIVKLGLKPGTTARFINAPDHYRNLLGRLPAGVRVVKSARGPLDFIHY